MAEIDSTAIGAGRRSLGNITYRYVKGKTIASRRITSNRSQTTKQQQQRLAFSLTGLLAKSLRTVIYHGFDNNQHGSPTSNFMRVNKEFMHYARTSDYLSRDLPAISNLCIALDDPKFRGKVVASSGSVNLTTVYDWGDDASLLARLYLSRDFVKGDVVTLAVCCSYQLVGSYFESIRLYDKELTNDEVEGLTFRNQYEITGSTYPGVDIFAELPPGFSELELAVTVIVTGEKDRSTSYFSVMPDMIPFFEVTSQSIVDSKHMRIVVKDIQEFYRLMKDQMIGASVFIPYDKHVPNGDYFPINEFSKDDEHIINGIICYSNSEYEFDIPFSGNETNDGAIYKDGKILCMLTDILYPTMAL